MPSKPAVEAARKLNTYLPIGETFMQRVTDDIQQAIDASRALGLTAEQAAPSIVRLVVDRTDNNGELDPGDKLPLEREVAAIIQRSNRAAVEADRREREGQYAKLLTVCREAVRAGGPGIDLGGRQVDPWLVELRAALEPFKETQ